MNGLTTWRKIWSLVGGAVISSSMLGTTTALALPQAQIQEKLQSVPVFAIADQKGSPLIASPSPGSAEQRPIAGIFISHQDAQAFLDGLRRDNPTLAQQVQLITVSLGEVYKMNQAGQSQANGLQFAFLPKQSQVASALTLANQNLRPGQPRLETFNGVPLFYATGGQNGGYLTIQQNNQQVIPLFFQKEELTALLDRFKQQQPNLANSVRIQVINLEGFIQTLEEKNDPQLQQLILIPSGESLTYVRSLQPAQSTQPLQPVQPVQPTQSPQPVQPIQPVQSPQPVQPTPSAPSQP